MASDGQLFDEMQTAFGLGDYQPDRDGPWYKWRAAQIGKQKRIRHNREVDLAHLMISVRYAKATSKKVRSIFDLIEMIPEALTWQREQDKAVCTRDIDALIAEAIEIEADRGGGPWMDRLIRASGPDREATYHDWKRWNQARHG